jgi:CRISPR-associated protein Cas5 subtype I-B
MKGFQLKIEGNWGHFKRPETNNNPLSHDFITKTALLGLIGAVIGIERDEMKKMFPQLSDDLLYGVQLLNPVKKISWGFTSRTAIEPTAPGNPKYFEFLRNPAFKVCIALKSGRSESIYEHFKQSVKVEESVYTPVLGWHNCPADLRFIAEGIFTTIADGEFDTFGFTETPPRHNPVVKDLKFRIGFEKVPTYQNDDFWNFPDKYIQVIYPDAPHSFKARGEHFEFSVNKEKWWLI